MIGWRTTPLIVIFAGVLVWAFTMLLFSRIENEPNVFAQLKWHIAGMVAIVYVAMSLFVFFVVLAPFRIAKEAETKLATAKVDADTRVAAAQADADRKIAAIRAEFDALSKQLDDRAKQQQKADEYASAVDSGRKIMVRWVDVSRKNDTAGIATERAAAFEWLKKVRAKLTTDFGSSVATRFNLGKPPDMNLGLSEPREHEARVVELAKLVSEMRSGQLPLHIPVTR